MVIKNYKELCKLLETKVKTGGAKQTQLDKLRCFCNYHKDGNKFIIDEILELPINRKGYLDYIEKLILDLLVQDKNNGKVFLSKNQLLKNLHMVNQNYNICKYRIPKLSKFMNINTFVVQDWFNSTNSMLERNLEQALKSLENQALVKWSKEITVCKITNEKLNDNNENLIKKIVKYDEYNEEIIEYKIDDNLKREYREATEEEKKFILRTERNILLELECENKQEIIKKDLWEVFDNKVKDIILKKQNIAFYYSSYKILCNDDHILQKWEQLYDLLLKDNEREKKQLILNKSIIEKIHENAKKRRNKENTKQFREYNNYIKDNDKISNNMIKENSKDIRTEIIKTKIK